MDLTDAQLASLDQLTFEVVDLGGAHLGLSFPGIVLIDNDAAGHGWFVDATPFDDAEFAHALSAHAAADRPVRGAGRPLDLLTAVMHEIGHALGLEDTYAAADHDQLMSGLLVTGERRLPDAGAELFDDHDFSGADGDTNQPDIRGRAFPATTDIVNGTEGDDQITDL